MNDLKTDPLLESKRLLETAAGFAQEYLTQINQRRVAPASADVAALSAFTTAMPESPGDPMGTLEVLHKIGSPATVATVAGRFYGLVVGGSLPATVGARVLNAAWDQMATSQATSPIAVHLEKVAAMWLRDIFNLAEQTSVGFVTGTTMGNFVCLAAARHRILSRHNWNVEKLGLNGAPNIRIVASEEVHITVKKVISMLGFGSENIESVPCDANGAMLVDKMPSLDPDTIVLAQVGNVNSGAIDPIAEIATKSRARGAWLHVDGAFGLWAAASRRKQHLTAGLERVDSCVTDGHKWLNTPYDCGIAMCADPEAMHNAMSTTAPYFAEGFDAAPKDMVPELSRSARSLDIWAALHSLGKSGVESLVDRCCQHARLAATRLSDNGFEVLNDVVLNQVVVSHPHHEAKLQALTERVCASGEAWFGPTQWQGRRGFRMSFSSWVTQDEDVERAVDAILVIAKQMQIIR